MPKEAIREEESKTVAEKELLLFCTSLAEKIVEDGGLEKFLQENPEHAKALLTARQEVKENPAIMNLASELSEVPVKDLEQSHDALEMLCTELIGANNGAGE